MPTAQRTVLIGAFSLTICLTGLVGCAVSPTLKPTNAPSHAGPAGGAIPTATAMSERDDIDCATIGVSIQDVASITGLPFATTHEVANGCGYVSTPDAGGRTVTAEIVRLPIRSLQDFETTYTAMSSTGSAGTCTWHTAEHTAYTCTGIVPAAAAGFVGGSQTVVFRDDHALQIVLATNIPDYASATDSGSRPLADGLVQRGL